MGACASEPRTKKAGNLGIDFLDCPNALQPDHLLLSCPLLDCPPGAKAAPASHNLFQLILGSQYLPVGMLAFSWRGAHGRRVLWKFAIGRPLARTPAGHCASRFAAKGCVSGRFTALRSCCERCTCQAGAGCIYVLDSDPSRNVCFKSGDERLEECRRRVQH